MRTDSAIRAETFHPYRVGQVWTALTDPAALAGWLLPNDFEATAGHWCTFRGDPEPPSFDGIVHCEVVEVEPLRSLTFTWRGQAGATTLVRWELTAGKWQGAGGTLLVSLHSGFDLTDDAQLAAFRALAPRWGGGYVAALDRVLQALG
jgi:uncharacterized protein YndB with AHSA1/START domain